jgi:DNA helicase-2/ATP-dependent DNA helicase PcrA
MVEEKLEPEVVQIFEHIQNGKNFLLSGGAGSGKTYSLVQVIKKAITDNPTAKVACMTYTNAAVKEIEERVGHDNLNVSTIHDFLWDSIKSFKKELKKSLIVLLNDDDSSIRKPSGEEVIDNTYFDNVENGIQYKEYLKIKEGIISHDEVLVLANYMFGHYPLLCDILKDKFKFIFVDEYQDTNSLVIEILLIHFKQSKKKNIIGFFGDAMQSIYDDGIGDLKQYVDSNDVKEVLKNQNRRNPQLVIDLANKLRTDRLQQEPSTDEKAPNMLNGKVKQGNIKFLYSFGDSLSAIKSTVYFSGWNFNNAKQTKELNLTLNLIASKAGFTELMEIYDKDPIIKLKNDIVDRMKENGREFGEETTFDEVVNQIQLTKGRGKDKRLIKELLLEDPKTKPLYEQLGSFPFSIVRKIYLNKDALIDDKKQNEDDENKKGSKRDKFVKHLFKIQTNIHLYKEKRYNEFLRNTEFRINSIADKQSIKNIIADMSEMSDYTIEDVINAADEKGICRKDDSFNQFVENNQYLYDRVKAIKFQEFQNLYYYLEGFTPFSTQHKTKGAEFDNILIVLDNGRWNDYNFEYLFNINIYSALDKKKKESYPRILSRTQKIFYVCCTRAKENMIVYFDSPNDAVITQAKNWFGEGNVHNIDNRANT